MDITEIITDLVFQLAVIIFTARIFGKLASRVGIPSVLGELVSGIIIGPFALGGIALPGFPHGLFGVSESLAGAVSPELYAFAQIASIILLFASGLETDLSLFIKYSVSGGIIGIGGVVISFFFGAACAYFILPVLGIHCPSLFDVKCLFLGIMSTATSVGITARILSDKKRMDSPEGVTILAAAVFDDVLGIVLLAVVMGIVSALGTGKALSGGAIGIIALKAFGIWLLATALFILLSKKIARFVRFFGGATDFSIAALGVAFLLAGFFEKEHIAMIIGAYTTGLALSGTDIAPVIQEKIHSLYKFFVPIFFAVTGMSVDVTKLFSQNVLICGGIYTLFAVLSKLLGCGLPALGLGFNIKGGFRIGAGMIPRGEVALIIAGIGLTAKDAAGLPIVNQDLFGVVILMTLVTTLVAPSILNVSLSIKGRGTKKEIEDTESQMFEWDFNNQELTHLVMDFLHRDLRAEGFYVQMMNITDGICTARRGDTAISLREEGTKLVIETESKDMGFVKGELYETILRLEKSMKSLSALKNTEALQYGFACPENRLTNSMTRYLNKNCISCELKGNTKDEILEEMVTLLSQSGNVQNRQQVISALKEREAAGSTGLEKGIAIPHTKTNGVTETVVAIGIKKDGVNFEAMDGNPSRIFVMLVAPIDGTNPLMRAMAAFSGALMREEVRSALLQAKNADEIVEILKDSKKM
ncbi:MAG: cation:proton antiporter [Treponema sp.]|nr:cation:proton antiporter [Treponema sp.]